MGITGMTVGKWRKRYRGFGIEGMHDELRPRRPRTYEDDKVAEVINRALQT
jgi:putative transposase